MSLEQVRIVLVEPRGPINIGATARAMKNMGAKELVLVAPRCPPLHPHAITMAVAAREILSGAKVFETLEEAVASSSLVVGTTRRKGKRRGQMLTPREAAEEILRVAQIQRVSLLFGPEDRGLSNKELDLCQEIVTIPADERYGSLNLAQAVMIMLYELRIAAHPPTAQDRKLATSQELEAMYQHLERVLSRVGFLHEDNPQRMMTAFRRIFGRARLDAREVRIIRGVLHQVEWALDREGLRRTPKEG